MPGGGAAEEPRRKQQRQAIQAANDVLVTNTVYEPLTDSGGEEGFCRASSARSLGAAFPQDPGPGLRPARRSLVSPSSQAHGLCGTCCNRPSARAASERPSRREGKSTLSTS